MTEPLDLLATVRAHLAALGNTPGEVAATLRARGIRGVRRDVEHCPLANEVRALLPADLVPRVTDDVLRLVRFGGGDTRPSAWIPLPWACQGFVAHVDEGDYPDLCVPEPKEDPS